VNGRPGIDRADAWLDQGLAYEAMPSELARVAQGQSLRLRAAQARTTHQETQMIRTTRALPAALATTSRPAHRRTLAACVSLCLLPAVAFSTGAPVKLNGPMVPGGNILTSAISPDNTTVVYRADQDTDGVTELYSVPIAGGTPVKLNQPLISVDSDVNNFTITRDSRTVVFIADANALGVDEVFSVPIGGGPVTRLNSNVVSGGRIFDFSLSPDGTTVVYIGDQDTDEVTELYSVPASGGTPIKLSPPSTTTREVLGTRFISADSSTVVYIGDHNVNGVNEIFSVPIAGGTVTRLNNPLPPGGGTGLFGFRPSPDGSRVVFSADGETNNVHEIFSVPIGGGTVIKLNDTLPSGGAIFEFQITADSSRVVYRGEQKVEGINEIFSVPMDGGPITQLSIPGDNTFHYEISPDGSTLVYMTSTGGQGLEELFSVPVLGGEAIRLNAPVPDGESVGFFEISTDGRWVTYSTELIEGEGAPDTALFSVPIDGGTPIRLTPQFTAGSGTNTGDISPDSSFVVYVADQDTPGVREIYAVPIEGGASQKLNAPFVSGGDASSVRFSPDSRRILYVADQDTDGVNELYSLSRGEIAVGIFREGFEAPVGL
jgi:Tol biopolymer transport system component